MKKINSIVRVTAFTITLIFMVSCRWKNPRDLVCPHGLYGINNDSIDIHFAVIDQYYEYLSDYPGTTADFFFNLPGLAHKNGGRQLIFGGELKSWEEYFNLFNINTDSVSIIVVADSIVNRYGWGVIIANGIKNAEYIVPVSYLDSTYKYVFFPPTERMKDCIRMSPPYEELIQNYGITN